MRPSFFLDLMSFVKNHFQLAHCRGVRVRVRIVKCEVVLLLLLLSSCCQVVQGDAETVCRARGIRGKEFAVTDVNKDDM